MRGTIIIILFLLLYQIRDINGQTCCSGGVPLTGNLGMPLAASGTWQFSPSYDLNYMNTLKEGSHTVNDQSRKRLTQSLLFETGYSISDRLYISGLFTYVLQTRRIEQFGSVNTDFLHGVVDARRPGRQSMEFIRNHGFWSQEILIPFSYSPLC